MRRKAGGSSALLLALMTVSAPAFADVTAPLPDGFKAESTSTVVGVYAHAITFPGQAGIKSSLESLEKACIARGLAVQYVGSERRIHISYWLYRNGTESAIFKVFTITKQDVENCRVTIEEKREVLRSTEKTGVWPSPFSSRRLQCSGSRRCYPETMFGIKARCRAEGDAFQLSLECVSIERGPSRGMLLDSSYESDDMNGNGFKVRALMSNVPIDASLFDRSRTW